MKGVRLSLDLAPPHSVAHSVLVMNILSLLCCFFPIVAARVLLNHCLITLFLVAVAVAIAKLQLKTPIYKILLHFLAIKRNSNARFSPSHNRLRSSTLVLQFYRTNFIFIIIVVYLKNWCYNFLWKFDV